MLRKVQCAQTKGPERLHLSGTAGANGITNVLIRSCGADRCTEEAGASRLLH